MNKTDIDETEDNLTGGFADSGTSKMWSKTLKNLSSELSGIRALVVGDLSSSLDAENRRSNRFQKMWDQTISSLPSVTLPSSISDGLEIVSRANLETDAEARATAKLLREFAERAPKFGKALGDLEGVTRRNLVSEPQFQVKIMDRGFLQFESLLKQLIEALREVEEKFEKRRTKVEELRKTAGEKRKDLDLAVELAVGGNGDGGTSGGGIPSTKSGQKVNLIQEKALKALDTLRNKPLSEINKELVQTQAAGHSLDITMASNRQKETLDLLENMEDRIDDLEREKIVESCEDDRKAIEDALEIEKIRQEEELKNLMLAEEDEQGEGKGSVGDSEQKQKIAEKYNQNLADLEIRQKKELEEALLLENMVGLVETSDDDFSSDDTSSEDGSPESGSGADKDGEIAKIALKKLHMDSMHSLEMVESRKRRLRLGKLRCALGSRRVSLVQSCSVPEEIPSLLKEQDEKDKQEEGEILSVLSNNLASLRDTESKRQGEVFGACVNGGAGSFAKALKEEKESFCEKMREEEFEVAKECQKCGLSLEESKREESLEKARQGCLLWSVLNDVFAPRNKKSRRRKGKSRGTASARKPDPKALLRLCAEVEYDLLHSRLSRQESHSKALLLAHNEHSRASIADPEELAEFDAESKAKMGRLILAQKTSRKRQVKRLRMAQDEQMRHSTWAGGSLAATMEDLFRRMEEEAKKEFEDMKGFFGEISKLRGGKGVEEEGEAMGVSPKLPESVDILGTAFDMLKAGDEGTRKDGVDADYSSKLIAQHKAELDSLNHAMDRDADLAQERLRFRLAQKRKRLRAEKEAEGVMSREEIEEEEKKGKIEDEREVMELVAEKNVEKEKKMQEMEERQRSVREEAASSKDCALKEMAKEKARILHDHSEGLKILQDDLQREKEDKHRLLLDRLEKQREAKKRALARKKEEGLISEEEEKEELAEMEDELHREEMSTREQIDKLQADLMSDAIDEMKRVEMTGLEKLEDDDNADDKMREKLLEMHNKELARLQLVMADKHSSARSALEARIAARRAQKKAALSSFSSSESELANAEREMDKEDAEDRGELEKIIREEKIEIITSEKERLAKTVDGKADYKGEVERLKKLHDERLRELQRELERNGKEKKASLRKRLEARRKKKRSDLKAKFKAEGPEKGGKEIDAELEMEMRAFDEKEREMCEKEEEKIDQKIATVMKGHESAIVGGSAQAGPESDFDSQSDYLSKLKGIHATELANLQEDLKLSARRQRDVLRARLAAKKASKNQKLAARGATAEQLAASENLALTQDMNAINRLEKSIEEEKEKVTNECKSRQQEALKEVKESKGEGEDTYLAELARLKDMNDRATVILKGEMADAAAEKRRALRQRLEAKRKMKRAKLSQAIDGKAVDEEIVEREMTKVEKEFEAERRELEENLEQEAERALAIVASRGVNVDSNAAADISTSARTEVESQAEISKVEALHAQEIIFLKSGLEAKFAREKGVLEAEMAVLREKMRTKMVEEGAGDEEINKAMEDAKGDEIAAITAMEGEQKKSMEKEVEEKKVLQAAIMEEEGGDINFKDQLNKIQEEHEKGMLVLEHELEANKAKRKKALNDKLKARKAARELRKQQDGGTNTVSDVEEAAQDSLEVAKLEVEMNSLRNSTMDTVVTQEELITTSFKEGDELLSILQGQHREEIALMKEEMAAERNIMLAKMEARFNEQQGAIREERGKVGVDEVEIEKELEEQKANHMKEIARAMKNIEEKESMKVQMKEKEQKRGDDKKLSDNEKLAKLKEQNELATKEIEGEIAAKKRAQKEKLRER